MMMSEPQKLTAKFRGSDAMLDHRLI